MSTEERRRGLYSINYNIHYSFGYLFSYAIANNGHYFLANIFIPDPIPVFDEVIMILGLLSKIDAMEKVFNVIEKIKNFLGGFFKVIVVIILALCIWGIIAYFT